MQRNEGEGAEEGGERKPKNITANNWIFTIGKSSEHYSRPSGGGGGVLKSPQRKMYKVARTFKEDFCTPFTEPGTNLTEQPCGSIMRECKVGGLSSCHYD